MVVCKRMHKILYVGVGKQVPATSGIWQVNRPRGSLQKILVRHSASSGRETNGIDIASSTPLQPVRPIQLVHFPGYRSVDWGEYRHNSVRKAFHLMRSLDNIHVLNPEEPRAPMHDAQFLLGDDVHKSRKEQVAAPQEARVLQETRVATANSGWSKWISLYPPESSTRRGTERRSEKKHKIRQCRETKTVSSVFRVINEQINGFRQNRNCHGQINGYNFHSVRLGICWELIGPYTQLTRNVLGSDRNIVKGHDVRRLSTSVQKVTISCSLDVWPKPQPWCCRWREESNWRAGESSFPWPVLQPAVQALLAVAPLTNFLFIVFLVLCSPLVSCYELNSLHHKFCHVFLVIIANV